MTKEGETHLFTFSRSIVMASLMTLVAITHSSMSMIRFRPFCSNPIVTSHSRSSTASPLSFFPFPRLPPP